MTKSKLIHDFEILKISRLNTQTALEEFPDSEINSDYFYYYNDVCPRCLLKLKVYNNSIKGLGTTSLFVLPEKKTIVLYACCKNCSRDIAKSSRFGSRPVLNSKKAEATEDYIRSKIGV
ncbi:hypothetical protein [Cytobacillus horneckiae]|uniref:hypothetical protein n=1 Tax=Cytobacillus horneckiae TaxID=549687 RepID=UPI003D1F0626